MFFSGSDFRNKVLLSGASIWFLQDSDQFFGIGSGFYKISRLLRNGLRILNSSGFSDRVGRQDRVDGFSETGSGFFRQGRSGFQRIRKK